MVNEILSGNRVNVGRFGAALIWSAALAAGGWLAGCASDTPDKSIAETKQQTPIPSLEEFTTVGKPTKTIETPNGPVKVYDPARDLTVKAAFNIVYARGDVTFGDVSRFNGVTSNDPETLSRHGFPLGSRPAVPTIDAVTLGLARQTQYYDMMRLGCKIIDEIPNQNYGRQSLGKSCSYASLGHSKLSECEIENIITHTEMQNPEIVHVSANDVTKGRWHVFYGQENRSGRYLTESGYPYYTAYARPIDLSGTEYNIQNVFFIGSQSSLTAGESFALLTHVKCRKWHDDKFFELKNIGE